VKSEFFIFTYFSTILWRIFPTCPNHGSSGAQQVNISKNDQKMTRTNFHAYLYGKTHRNTR
jgi:hypothetical protein